MTNPAAGVYKQVAYKAESAFGTAAGASGAQALRRVQSTLDLNKDTYQSNEIRTDFQIADFRHGVRRVRGKITGELSAGTYKDFFAAALKKAFGAKSALAGIDITIAAGSGSTWTVTRSAGNWLTDGVKVGHVVRLGVGALNALNLSKNLFVLGVTATVLTVMTLNGSALSPEAVTGVTVSFPGKNTYVPQAGHTDDSFSIEHYYSDQGQSELFTGCKPTQIALGLPPTGLATIDMDFLGQDVTTASSAYFTSPGALTTTGAMAAVNGVCCIGGTPVAVLTGLSININANYTGDPVVGNNKIPFLFPGRVVVTGQATAYFDSVTLRDAFINETEISLLPVLTASNAAAADFLAFAMTRIKVGGAAKNDGEGGLIQTIPFQALLDTAGGSGAATEKTTFLMQDAQA